MENEHAETVVDKAVAYVKDMVGIHPASEAEPERDYPDTAPEITAENAMRLDPNAYKLGDGQVNAEAYPRPVGETDEEKTALELNAESARAEEGQQTR